MIAIILAAIYAVSLGIDTKNIVETTVPTDPPVETQAPTPTPEVTPEPTLEPTPTQAPTQAPTPTPTPKPTEPPRNITQNKILFPSDSKYITEADLSGLSKYDVDLIRNEIFARKGYVFTNKTFKNYFESQSWYTPNPAANYNMKLNEYEQYNANFILEYQVAQGWK